MLNIRIPTGAKLIVTAIVFVVVATVAWLATQGPERRASTDALTAIAVDPAVNDAAEDAGRQGDVGGDFPPLRQAVVDGDLERLNALLAAGNQPLEELHHSLMAAAGVGRRQAADILIAAGADPTVRVPFNGWTAVTIAVREDNPDVLDVLLRNGGDPNHPDDIGWRPLHHAVLADKQHVEVIRVLIRHGAHVDGLDGLQRTVLHRAAGFGHLEAVQSLLDNGADPHLREKYGLTARQRALRGGYAKVAELLASRMR